MFLFYKKPNLALFWLKTGVIIILISAIFFIIAIFCYLIFEKKYHERIYPGVYLGSFNLGGLNRQEAEDFLKQKVNLINQKGIDIYFKDANNSAQTKIFPIISSFSGDIAREIIKFDLGKTVNQALLEGRKEDIKPKSLKPEDLFSFLNNLENKIKIARFGTKINLSFSLNSLEIKKSLKESFEALEDPAQDASLIINKDSGQITFDVKEEKLGQVMDYEALLEKLKNNLARLDLAEIEIELKTDYPKVYSEDGLRISEEANKILSFAPFYLISTSSPLLSNKIKKWTIYPETLADWLEFKRDNEHKTIIGLNQKAEDYLVENIVPQVDVAPKDAKLSIQGGKVSEFQAGKDGLKLNLEKSLALIEDSILTEGANKNIAIVIEKEKAKSMNDINDLGIKEIIGGGDSDFSGSPNNRRHNIKTGAGALNGIVIKPQEEFSLIKALGAIDDATGYLPELVIKGDKTIKEFGGGLCQIGTTLFRTVINAGLPVTMRQNHSYRVSYYEPAGTDATIYDPLPDFRFINDTDKAILIQTYMGENKLHFDFWGTKDGRIASSTYPVIYNITKPESTKIIETAELEPGEKKCTEHAHSGADAYFDYSVLYPNGALKEKRFKSHYIPWQEVCLVGIEKATSTEQAILNN